MWMVYDAERDEALVPKSSGGKEKEREPTGRRVRIAMRDASGRAQASGKRKHATAQVYLGVVSRADHFFWYHLLHPGDGACRGLAQLR